MLKLSRFVLEVLPYLLSALIAAIVVPGFLNSHFHGTSPEGAVAVSESRVNALELVRQDHAVFAPKQGYRPCAPAQRSTGHRQNRRSTCRAIGNGCPSLFRNLRLVSFRL